MFKQDLEEKCEKITIPEIISGSCKFIVKSIPVDCVRGLFVVQWAKSILGDVMFKNYLMIFLVSMVPLIELRGAMPIAVGLDIPFLPALITCVIGNMLPVPIIYFFARKFLTWGAGQRYIGKFCNFFLIKGERAGQKLVKKAGRGGLFVALMLFVGIPLPGTGAWTGALGASFLNMGIKSTALSVSLGVVIAGIIMAVASTGVLSVFGL